MRSRRAARALLTLAVGAALTLGVLPAAAAPAPDSVPGVAALPGDVNDFEFASFDAVYELGRDDDGRSTLTTTEHLVAVFPDFDQNRGIIRELVAVYQGHETQVQVTSVTDETGAGRSWETERVGDFVRVTIAVPPGQYVRGEQHYVIEYTQRDVIGEFDDTDDQEFYWDTNGDGWRQPFGRVDATVVVAPDLVPALTGNAACYVGYFGVDEPCEISRDGAEFTAGSVDLYPGENVTVAIGFEPGTFAAVPWTSRIPPAAYAGIIVLGLIVLGIVLAIVVRLTLVRDAPGRGIVVAQYEPYPGVSPLVAANLMWRKRTGFAATIVDLAVRGKLRILENDSGWAKTFGVQKIDGTDLGPDDERVMAALFGLGGSVYTGLPGLLLGRNVTTDPDVGQVRWLTKNDRMLGQQVVAMTKSITQEVRTSGLRRKPPRWPVRVLVLLYVAAGLVALSQIFLGGDEELAVATTVIGLNLIPWVAIATIGLVAGRWPLSSRGAEITEHLEGLREFIRLAEADRLRMLQSVSGAERVSTESGDVIRIYEKLLPYAVIFGLEKEWLAELSRYYDESTSPDWYHGASMTTFNAALFSSAISSFSSTMSSTYSGSTSSSSSSSGGSSGGGSSGGGGGGGGGGGI